MDFIELARSRYSCKSFDSRQISKEQLDSILEAGNWQHRLTEFKIGAILTISLA